MSRNILKVALLALISLAGCSLVRDQAYNLGYKDRRALDTLRKQSLYSLKADGVFDQKDHELILFDGDTLTMRFSYMVNGVENSLAEYSVEVIEDSSALEGIYRLYGTGPLSGKYLGMTLLTNNNGAYAKLNFQDSPAEVLEGARAQAEWNWVTDPLAFRSFKTFPVDVPVVFLSDANAPAPATGGTNASTKQSDLRFIKLAHPAQLSHTNVIASVDKKGTDHIADDVYTLVFNQVWPNGKDLSSAEVSEKIVTYEIRSVRMIAPNTEIYGVTIKDVGAGYTSSPVATPGSPFTAGSTGFLAIEFSYDANRSKTASRMAFDVVEVNALSEMQRRPHYRWESISTADLPTRVLDRFKGQPVVRVSHYITDDVTPGRKAEIPLAYNAENTREFHFDITNFSVRVLDVANRVTNATTYRFRMVDDTSTNEGVIQLQGSVGLLAGQYFHFRHYYPAAGEVNHGYTTSPDTFIPGTGADGSSRPANDTRLLVKIGQGADEAAASAAVRTTANDDAAKIIYQSKTNAYKPHRLFVNMHKRGGSWVGVQDDGNYNTEAATNWAINSISRVVQIRISTNAAPKFSTYRFHTLVDISDNRIVAVLSNVKNQSAPGDMRDHFLEPAIDPVFPNADNDASREELSPFHGKYVALELGTGVDNTRAKVEYADTLSEALTKLDNRTAWNLYESTAVPTPNRIIKTLAGSSPWIRLDADGYFNSTHTERFNFDADDMTATIFWHRGAAASLDNNIVAAAKYTIPLPMEADTSLQEGIFIMRGAADNVVRVPITGAPGTFYNLPTDSTVTSGGVQLELEDSGAYKYADKNTGTLYYYSALVGTLSDANKARVGKGTSRSDAEAARVALGSRWLWHTLADAPLSPAVILHLMRTTTENGNSPLITSEVAYNVNAATGAPTGTDFLYKPYATYEYEFANTPSLQVTVRRIQDTTVTTAVYPLVIVNNVDKSKTIVRLGGSASLGNYAPGRFMLIRIPSDVDTTATVPANRKYATNAAIAVFPTQADAENYTARITTVPMGQITNSTDFDTLYNIRLKKVVAFNLNRLPFTKSYQLLLPHKVGANEFYDTYDIFNPNFLGSAFVRFTNLAAAPATDYRIDIKNANNLDYSSYTYEVMAENATDNTLYVKLNGEGGLYHNRFAAFRFNAAYTANPDKMHAVIGQGVFADLSNALAGQKATETTTGWRYRALDVLTNKDFLAFRALARADKDSLRIGSFVRVDKNGVYRSQDTDIFKFDFPTAAGESVTNMQISVTVKKPDGTENTGRYYFVPLKGTPANNGAGASHGASPGTGSGVNDIQRGYLMHGYMISVNFGVDGSSTLVPYNNHFVILRTDVTNDPAAADTSPNYDRVRSVIIATNNSSLGTIADPIQETGATTAYSLYNFWWKNGTNVIGASAIPGLAFNFRAQASTDINSRIIDHMAVNKWVTLSNIPANSFTAGSAAMRYIYDPQNHQTWDFNALTRRVTISTVNAGGTAVVGSYDIKMQSSDNDYEGYIQLSTATGSADSTYHQKFVYLQVPGASNETAVVTDRRSRDARIIMGDSTVIGAGTTPVANNLTALQAARTAIIAEAATNGEWNAANADLASSDEKAFKSFHRRGRAFFTYESGTAAVDPSANDRASSDEWNKDHWLSFMPLIRQRTSTDTAITNLLLQRKGLSGTDYQYTNVIKMMQADAGRTVLQLAGTNAQATASVNFSNLFMGVEYGNDVNDRTAKVVYSSTRAGVIEALNLRTTYNYFDSEMATNSKNHEKLVEIALGADRGFEWVQVSNTIHNPTGAATPGVPGLPGAYNPALPASDNITDTDTYDKFTYNATATTNFVLDHNNKIVREMRVDGSATNVFVYGYTVIESGLVPNLGGTTTRQANTRYRFVIRLEGFGDYKNYFAAGEIGRFNASVADPSADPISKGSTAAIGSEDERYKARMIFGKTVAQAKELLKYLQGSSSISGAPSAGTWNLISKTILTMPSPLLDSTETKAGYPVAPATRIQGLNGRTGDPALIDPARPAATVNANYYSRLASATGMQNNVIDSDNHTNFAFWNENSEPVVFVTTVQSNVASTVRYKAVVKENYFKSPVVSRRSNDVIIWLDNLGSPLHSYFIGIRRHAINPGATNNDLRGDYFSAIIDSNETVVQNALGALNLAAGSPGLSAQLPMVLRFSNDMARVAGGDNLAAIPAAQIIEHFTSTNAGSFASLDEDGIYMNLSNAQWNYNAATKLMTINYLSDSGTYQDAFTGNAKTGAESYRVIPVLTSLSDANRSRGHGVVLFRSDTSGGAAAGDLHNKYIAVMYHGNEAATAHTGADLVYLSHTNSIGDAVSDLGVKGSSAVAQFTVIRPYIGIDLAPLNYMTQVRDPDSPANLPGTWALLNTGSNAAKRYQLDPSNTTLYKVDVDKRILYEEKVVTTLSGANLDYSGTPQRSAIAYRINLVRAIPNTVAVGYKNYAQQITFTAVRGKAYANGVNAPITGMAINAAPADTNDKYLIVRTKKRISDKNTNPPTWEDISAESLYIGVTNRTSGSSHVDINNFLDLPVNSDPYGAAAYTATVNRSALNYWNVFMGQNDWWFMTTSKNTFSTNTFNPTTSANPNSMAFTFDANTGNGGLSHGDGGLSSGVVNVNVGFQPLDMVTGNVLAARNYSGGKMLNFWQRLIRQVDADTFIFQLYGGQNMSSQPYATYTSAGVSYTADNVRTAVSNKYWIIRAGQGTDLFRARITNGTTAAEALQNLGLLTSPNFAADRGVNRIVLSNIRKNVDFVGNSEVNPLTKTSADPSTLTTAEQEALFSNRAPVALEVDNYTNWSFSPDLDNPAVTITIRSNAGGSVGEQTVTYGLTPIYSPAISEQWRGLFSLTGFGPFAGRIFAVRLNNADTTQMRIVMAPADLTRGYNTGTTVTNTNLGFLIAAMNANPGSADQEQLTYKATKSGSTTTWSNQTFYNFVTKSSMLVDAGIASALDSTNLRVLFKHNFGADNAQLTPSRWHDPDNTTNYSVNASVVPPTFTIQPSGQSSVTYNITRATPVTTANQTIKDDLDPTAGTNRTMTAAVRYGALHIGDGNDFVGIKTVTTNGGTEGNAGLFVVRSTVSMTEALDKVRDAGTATDSRIPDHAYARDIVFTQNALDYIGSSAVGTITLMTDFSTYNEYDTTEYVFNSVTKTVQLISISNGSITKSDVYTTVPVLDWNTADPTVSSNRKSVFLLKGQGDRKSTFLKVLNNATLVVTPRMSGLAIYPKYGFVIEENQNNSNMTSSLYVTAQGDRNLQIYNARIKSTYNSPNLSDVTNFNLMLNHYNINGTTGDVTSVVPNSVPHARTVSYYGLKKIAELFNGKYSGLSGGQLSSLSTPTDTVYEIEFDYPRKLMLTRQRASGASSPTNVDLYALVATNRLSYLTPNGGGKPDLPIASDRGNYYMLHLAVLRPTATMDDVRRLNTFGNLTNDTAVYLSAGTPETKNNHSSWKLGYTGHSSDPDNYLAEGDTNWSKVDSLFYDITGASWAINLQRRRNNENNDPQFVPYQTVSTVVGGNEKIAVVISNFNRSMNGGHGVLPAIPVNDLGNYAAQELVIQLTNNGVKSEMYVGRNEKQWKTGVLGTGNGTAGVGTIPYHDYWGNTAWMAKYPIRMVKYHNDNYAVYRIFGGSVLMAGMTAENTWLKASYRPSANFQPLQPASTGLSNYFMAVQVGTGANDHRAKIAFGDSIAEAESAIASVSYNNYMAGATAQSSEIYLEFLRVGNATNFWYWDKGTTAGDVIVEQPGVTLNLSLLNNDPSTRVIFAKAGGRDNPSGDGNHIYSLELVWGLNPDVVEPARSTTPATYGQPSLATNTGVTPNIIYFTGTLPARNMNTLRYPYDTAESPLASWTYRDWTKSTIQTKTVNTRASEFGSIYKFVGWGPLNGHFIRILPKVSSGHTVLRVSKTLSNLRITTTDPEGDLVLGSEIAVPVP